MARLAIVWRNPNCMQRLRCWSRVRGNATRRLYLIVESAAAGPSAWQGLPSLEIITARSKAGASQAVQLSAALSANT